MAFKDLGIKLEDIMKYTAEQVQSCIIPWHPRQCTMADPWLSIEPCPTATS